MKYVKQKLLKSRLLTSSKGYEDFLKYPLLYDSLFYNILNKENVFKHAAIAEQRIPYLAY